MYIATRAGREGGGEGRERGRERGMEEGEREVNNSTMPPGKLQPVDRDSTLDTHKSPIITLASKVLASWILCGLVGC